MGIKFFLQRVNIVNKSYILLKWREKKVSYGNDNSDKTFYVIRRANSKCGLFSYVSTMMGGVKFALDNGYIPVIDMQNEKNTYLDDEKVGLVNSWEYYFKQPANYSLEDIKYSKNIILSNGVLKSTDYYPSVEVGWDEGEYIKWHDFCGKYLKISDRLNKKFEDDFNILSENGEKKILGVLVRGTDYISTSPKNHPIQPDVTQIMEKIDEQLMCGEYDAIYLATEDADIYVTLKGKYGELLHAPRVKRYSQKEVDNINDASEDRLDDKRLKGEEYLESIWFLSRCKGLIAGNVSGTIGALLMNDAYEYKYIFNLGVYM